MKPLLFSALLLLTLGLGAQPASAQILYWDTNGSTPGTSATATANWNGTTDWTTDATGSSATIGYVSGDSVVFSAGSNGTGAQNITVNGATSTAGITINNGTLTLTGSSSPSLSIGSGGLTLASTADGAASIANSLPVVIAASQNWANNSTRNFSDAGAISGTGTILTFNGTGTGRTTLSGVISGTMGLAATSATSALFITPTGTDTYSGGLAVSNGAVAVISSNGAAGGGVTLSGGGTLETSAGFTMTSGITLGTGGGQIVAGVLLNGVQISGNDTVLSNTITGGTGLTVLAGDLLINSATSNVGTLGITSLYTNTNGVGTGTGYTRALLQSSGILANNATVNVGTNTILDLSFGFSGTNTIMFASGSGLEHRGNAGITLSTTNVTLPTAGNFTVGSDDTLDTGKVTINGALALTGPLTIYDNVNPAVTDGSGMTFANTFSGTSALTFAPGNFRSGGIILLTGSNTSFTGGIYIDTGAVVGLKTSANAGGGSGNNIHIAGGVLDLGTGAFPLNGFVANIVLDTPTGTGTQDTLKGIGGVDTFSGKILNGTTDTLHVLSDNISFAPSSAGTVSNYTTLYIDSNRLFISGSFGLNALPTGTIYVTASGAGLDFNTSTTFTVNNTINFASGSQLVTRLINTSVGTIGTFTQANLPTAGTFVIGTDDTDNKTLSSITITTPLALTGDLALTVNNYSTASVASKENVFLNGNISGTGGLSETTGMNMAGSVNPGLLTLGGTNTYNGGTTVLFGTMTIKGNSSGTGTDYAVQNGTLNIASTGSIPTAANVTLGNAATSGMLALGDAAGAVTQTVASLVTSGTGTTNAVVGGGSASTSTLTINNSADDTFSGKIGGAGTNQNLVAVAKTGAGTLTLSGANTYIGGTTVSGGKLAVDGSIAGNASVGLNAEIGGHGSIAGTISGAGAVGPGNSPGILSASAVNPTGGTSFNFEFTLTGAPAYGSASASGNDVLHLEGATPFTAALTAGNTIALYFAAAGTGYEGGFFINGATDLLSSNVANATFLYYVLDATGAISYNGNNYDLTTGSASTMQVASAAFGDGTTNGFIEVFNVNTVPEPSTYGLMLVGVAGLFFLNRRLARRI